MRSATLVIASLIGAFGCAPGKSAGSRDTLTARQRDSVIGASQLPGAQGVRGALRVSDSADARRAREKAAGESP